MKTLTKIIRGVLIYWIIFVIVSWIAFFVRGEIPDTLIQYGLGGGAAELLAGAFIEVGKRWIEKKYIGGIDDDRGNDAGGDPGADDSTGDCDQSGDTGGQDALG